MTFFRGPYFFTALLVLFAAVVAAAGPLKPKPSKSQIEQGFRIAPVPLNTRGLNRNLVGLGSYIVNSTGSCGSCHTVPQFAPGGNPFLGEPEQVNTENYLAGGLLFGPLLPVPNITPDQHGLPAGHGYEEFLALMTEGEAHHHPGIQQIMPWPVYRNMTPLDLRAIYEYLRAIPHAEPAAQPPVQATGRGTR